MTVVCSGAGRCTWTRDNPDSDIWLTSCGSAWCLNEGTPKENRMKFCPFCGREIKEAGDAVHDN